MRNLVIFGLVAACTILVASESAMASGGGAGGPGKTKSRARFVITNIEPANGNGIAVWVRPPGTPVPNTLGQFRNQLIFIAPGTIRQTSKLKNGAYEVASFRAAALDGPDNLVITPAQINFLVRSDQTFNINGNNINLNVNLATIQKTN